MERLFPGPVEEVTVGEVVASYEPRASPPADRPHVYTNFAVTVDGHAAIDGRAGPIGSAVDLQMLVALRMCADAVMIGGATLRAERYGRIMRDPQKRAVRERRGLPHDPLAVIISGSLDLPWDTDLFTCGAGRILIFTSSDDEIPDTATPVRVERHAGGRVDLTEALRHLRVDRGIRGLLCEGGPMLHGDLLDAGMVDELFVTRGPLLGGGEAPGLARGMSANITRLELVWLLREGSEIFHRYRVRR